MKKILYLITIGFALAIGLSACKQKVEEPVQAVDLRYRVEDSYNLDALSPRPFTIVVKSSMPWTIKSEHPLWCIIDLEEGEAVPDSLVHVGKGESTSVRVQYYDNTGLDDRTDIITIASGEFAKKVTVYQNGTAYLTVPEAELEDGLMIAKTGGELIINVNCNQNWSAKILDMEGDWLSIAEGASGSLDGKVKLVAKENPAEQRYATVAIYDRHDVLQARVAITQDGVQLEPEEMEIRLSYEACVYELPVKANTRWTAEKESEGDDWFTIENPSNNGSAKLRLTVTENPDSDIRNATIILKTVAEGGAFQAKKEVLLRQAYKETPIRIQFDETEISNWSVTSRAPDWTGTPVAVENGMLLETPTQISRSMDPPGCYNFHWTNITGEPCVRLWYVFSGSQEIKYKLPYSSGSTEVSLNSNALGGDSVSLKNVEFDTSKGHDIGIKFAPLAGGNCHVTFMLDGVEFTSFDTTDKILSNGKWGSNVTVYLGVEEGGSAICEWYEYTQPFSWDE